MKVLQVRLQDFRSWQALTMTPNSHLNLILGENGSGKTNFLEALSFLAAGRGFRGQKTSELIRLQAAFFSIDARFQSTDSQREQRLFTAYSRTGKRRISLNGVDERRFADLPVRLYSVLFTPDDLSIIKGSPSQRRDFMDRELARVRPEIHANRLRYQRILQQRNELLRNIRRRKQDKEALRPWNVEMARLGSALIYNRLQFLQVLVPEARRLYRAMAPQAPAFEATYQASLGAHMLKISLTDMQAHFLSTLEANQEEEIARGATLFGPHRDDLLFYLGQRPLRTYGSQGQQRMAVLALKLAEIGAINKLVGKKPILLLDDVLSELDEAKRLALLAVVEKEEIQTFMTATDLNDPLGENVKKSIYVAENGTLILKS